MHLTPLDYHTEQAEEQRRGAGCFLRRPEPPSIRCPPICDSQSPRSPLRPNAPITPIDPVKPIARSKPRTLSGSLPIPPPFCAFLSLSIPLFVSLSLSLLFLYLPRSLSLSFFLFSLVLSLPLVRVGQGGERSRGGNGGVGALERLNVIRFLCRDPKMSPTP